MSKYLPLKRQFNVIASFANRDRYIYISRQRAGNSRRPNCQLVMLSCSTTTSTFGVPCLSALIEERNPPFENDTQMRDLVSRN